jgi:DNA repair exonuclease SbcCD ATPase subunit
MSTPRTDANVKKHNLCQFSGNDFVHANFPRQLERELTAMTEQRDEARKKIKSLREWSAALANILDNTRSELAAMAEQLDELAEDRGKWIEFAERRLIKIDAQAERLRYLEGATNHATGTPLTKAIEQRDRMAVLLSDMQDYTKGVKRYDYSKLTLYERMEALHDDWQEIECRIEQCLTNTTQTKPK